MRRCDSRWRRRTRYVCSGVPRAVLDTSVLEVLRRDTFRRYVSETEADAYVELIRSEGVVRADPAPSPEPLSADPDDEYLIDLARDAQVDALVTGDAHLLELRAIIPAMTPAEFLELLPGR